MRGQGRRVGGGETRSGRVRELPLSDDDSFRRTSTGGDGCRAAESVRIWVHVESRRNASRHVLALSISTGRGEAVP